MDVKEAIMRRRSVRKYTPRAVSKETIRELVEAARLAPSACNAQPSMFKIVKNSKTKAELKNNKIFKQDFVCNAPVIIVCCANPDVYPKSKLESGFDDPYEHRALKDVSIASQNLILRATELGLGTCYIGWMNKNKIKTVLGIPQSYVVPFAITVGYPAEKPKQTQRKKLEKIIIK